MRNHESFSILLAVLLFSSCILFFPVRASFIFSDGFESGDFSAWTGTAVTSDCGSLDISTSQMHSGSYSERAQVASQNAWTDAYVYKSIPRFSTLYSRFYIYLENLSTQYYIEGFGEYSGAGVIVVYFGLRGDRSLWLLYRNGTKYKDAFSSTKLPLHTWVCLEMKTTVDNSMGEVRVWMNGNEISDLTQTNVNNSEAQSIQEVKYGIYSAYATNATLYIDDVVVADAYIGPEYQTIFAQSGLDGTSLGTVVTINGSQQDYSDLPFIGIVSSYSHTEYLYENTIATNVLGKRFTLINVTGPTSPFNVTSNTTITGNYETQYYLNIDSVYDSTFPLSDWYDSGTQITTFAVSPFQDTDGILHTCIGWTGTGSVPSSGTGTNTTFVLTEPSNITWHWNNEYCLTVSTDPSGLIPQPTRNPEGETGAPDNWWYVASASVNLTAHPAKGWDFTHWIIDGVIQDEGLNTITVTMDGPHATVAHYLLDNTPPSIIITSPENGIYYSSSIPLNFTINDTAHWIGYSLDDQENRTIAGNQTVAVGEGFHTLIVYANDTAGNMGTSDLIHFEARTDVSDVAITHIQTSEVTTGRGYLVTINVTVENQGDYTEHTSLTVFANATTIYLENVSLASHELSEVTVTWNTTGYPYGHYCLSAYLTPVSGETDTEDNTFTGCSVLVTIIGDVDGNFVVNILDVVRITGNYMATIGQPTYRSDADLNHDGVINILDVVICTSHYGEKYT